MIEVYPPVDTFAVNNKLAGKLARTLITIEQVPDIAMFRKNTPASVRELPEDWLSKVDGESADVRVQVPTNAAALNRDQRLAVVDQFTAMVTDAAGDPTLTDRTWVLLSDAPDGGWGVAGHANTNAELVDAARAQNSESSSQPSAETRAADGGRTAG
jgi:phenylpyruvate tautomerase PptA (4-oxalocrotonate tautomerase family)